MKLSFNPDSKFPLDLSPDNLLPFLPWIIFIYQIHKQFHSLFLSVILLIADSLRDSFTVRTMIHRTSAWAQSNDWKIAMI